MYVLVILSLVLWVNGTCNYTHSNPQHTPTIIQPSSSQPQKTQKPRKPTRKDTQVSQPSGLTESVRDEVVHKELGDRLVRAATTASSLKAKQDSGGPRFQETIRDTTAQTRFESVSKQSNDSLLARGSTLQSDKDSLKLDELMALCTTLQNKVLDLEKTTTTQFDAAQVSTTATTVTITTKDITLAQALEALKTSKPKDKGKEIMIEEPMKPKKKDQIRLDEEAAKSYKLNLINKKDLQEKKLRKKKEPILL
nr:hypothetical protein [Tanacetum cinerariifolium]